MKKHPFLYFIYIVLVLWIAAAAYITFSFPATLRNAQEDSWYAPTPDYLERTPFLERARQYARSYMPAPVLAATFVALPKLNAAREQFYAIEQAAEQEHWLLVRNKAKDFLSRYSNSQLADQQQMASVAFRYFLLSESQLGTLPYNLRTAYNIQTPEDFVMFRQRGRDACLFNALFFRSLDMPDEVTHQAFGYAENLNYHTRRQLRLLLESTAQAGDTLLFYKYKQLAQQAAVPVPSSAQLRPASVHNRDNIFVFGSPMLNLFVLHLQNAARNPACTEQLKKRLLDYACLSFILQGKPEACRALLQMLPLYSREQIPPIYEQKIKENVGSV